MLTACLAFFSDDYTPSAPVLRKNDENLVTAQTFPAINPKLNSVSPSLKWTECPWAVGNC
ncbi:MAG: hypothetical protein ON057_002061 [Glomeribacter sp. 1016415]|nr:hypothetical protein [Glomeribacter sp. 1016415]